MTCFLLLEFYVSLVSRLVYYCFCPHERLLYSRQYMAKFVWNNQQPRETCVAVCQSKVIYSQSQICDGMGCVMKCCSLVDTSIFDNLKK